jgi:hypothetical protein
MRVTPSITYRNFMAGIESLNARLEEANQQVATGKKLTHLDDSPAGSADLTTHLPEAPSWSGSGRSFRRSINSGKTATPFPISSLLRIRP